MARDDRSGLFDPLRRSRTGQLACAIATLVLMSGAAAAQGWNWPWAQSPKSQPLPPAPMNRAPPPPAEAPPPQNQPPPAAGWAQKDPNICLELEKRLVQESQKGDPSRNVLPMVESELRQVEQQLRDAQTQLDRSDCYETFFFSKSLRRTKKCVDLNSQVEGARQRIADLETQRSQLQATQGRSYQDEIMRELSRNGCGNNYTREAAKRDGNPFEKLWSEDDGGGPGGLGNFNALPYATYRTVCVRLCDGYFFPMSFSTLPNHFERDAEACQSKCAAPAELYYYQNPGGSAEQMQSFQSNAPYTALKSAFRYKKEFVAGCSCKQAEFIPEGGTPQQSGQAAPAGAAPGAVTAATPAGAAPGGGWVAREGGETLPWQQR